MFLDSVENHYVALFTEILFVIALKSVLICPTCSDRGARKEQISF